MYLRNSATKVQNIELFICFWELDIFIYFCRRLVQEQVQGQGGEEYIMLGFEGLDVYQRVRKLTVEVLTFIDTQKKIDLFIKDQLKRACLSVLLNIAEGTGRISVADKKHFLMIARGSLYETLALLTVLHDMGKVNDELFTDFYHRYEDCAKMLFGLYTKMKPFSENH